MQKNLRTRSQSVRKEKTNICNTKLTENESCRRTVSQIISDDGGGDCVVIFDKREAEEREIPRFVPNEETKKNPPKGITSKRTRNPLQRNKPEGSGEIESETLFKSLRHRVIKYHQVLPFENRKLKRNIDDCSNDKPCTETKDSTCIDFSDQKECTSFKVNESEDNVVQNEVSKITSCLSDSSKKDCKDMLILTSLKRLKNENLKITRECKLVQKILQGNDVSVEEENTPVELVVSEIDFKDNVVKPGSNSNTHSKETTEEPSCDMLDIEMLSKECLQSSLRRKKSTSSFAEDELPKSEENSLSLSQERALTEPENLDSFENALRELEKCLEDCD